MMEDVIAEMRAEALQKQASTASADDGAATVQEPDFPQPHGGNGSERRSATNGTSAPYPADGGAA